MTRLGILGVLFAALTYGAMACAAETGAPAAGKIDEMGGVGIYVADVERSVKFYTDVLGLKLVYRSKGEPPRETILSLSGQLRGGMGVSIYPASKEMLASAQPKMTRIIALTSSSKAMEQRARAAGVETRMGDDGKHLYFKDPDGYDILVFELIGSP